MKFVLPFILVAILLSACSGTTPATDTTPVAATIRMTSGAFEPTTVTVNKGEKVCWVNEDPEARWPASNIHPTHEIYSAFDPKGPVRSGATWCFTFDQAGIWKFHDHLFPELVGTVTVN